MFGRKPPTGEGDSAPPPANRIGPTSFQAAVERPTPPAPPRPVAVADAPPPTPTPAALRPAPAAAAAWGAPASAQPARRPEMTRAEPKGEPAREVRKLIVGRDINLSGEINACDHLIVEGTVEAKVRDCYRLEVAESGLFHGAVEIREAEIAGRFLGELIVQGRLSVRATGRVEGKIQYGELAVDAGGTLDGEVRVNDKGPKLVTDSDGAKPQPGAQPAESKPGAQPAESKIEAPSVESPSDAPNLL
jgi:cytoskeletal protein CcmA (bactofilin family)